MERKIIAIWTVLALLLFNSVFAQIESKHLYSSYSGINADADIFSDISLNSFEFISTNVQFSKNDDLQKIVVVPFKLIELDKWNQKLYSLKNTKINLAQRNGISTAGLGFTWDNSLPGTKRGERILDRYSDSILTIREKLNKNIVKQIRIDIKKAREGKLGYQLTDKMLLYLNSVVIPRLVSKPKIASLVPAERSNFTKDSGFGLNDFEYYKGITESYFKKYNSQLNSKIANKYYSELLQNSIKITVGGNYSFFSVLGSQDVDLDNDSLSDFEHNLKQRNLSVGLAHIVSEKWGYSLTGYLLEKRSDPEDGNDLEPYFGFSASTALRICVLDKEYKSKKFYKESLFVPSIHLGVSLEHLMCNADDDSDCSDSIAKSTSITPFLDFKITPKNQFRIGIPMSNNDLVDSQKFVVGSIFQWRLQLAGL